MAKLRIHLAVPLLLVWLTACEAPPPESSQPPAVAVASPTPPRLFGQIVVGARDQKAADMAAIDPTCAALQEAEGSAAGEVLVFLEDAPAPVPEAPPEALVITARRCFYEPAVAALRPGQRVILENGDPTVHQPITDQPDGQQLQLEHPFEGMRSELRFEPPRPVTEIGCASHPWMKAHLRLLNHPYFAHPDGGGRFEIPDPPPGDHTLVAWHPRLGERRKEVTVAAGSELEVSFDFASAPPSD